MDIEQIKIEGIISALKEHIRVKLWEAAIHCDAAKKDGFKDFPKYSSIAITKIKESIQLYAELKKVEGE